MVTGLTGKKVSLKPRYQAVGHGLVQVVPHQPSCLAAGDRPDGRGPSNREAEGVEVDGISGCLSKQHTRNGK